VRYLGFALLVLALAGGAWASLNPETGAFEGSQPAKVHFVNPSKDHMVPMKYQAPPPINYAAPSACAPE
jgi:hypothetical protein